MSILTQLVARGYIYYYVLYLKLQPFYNYRNTSQHAVNLLSVSYLIVPRFLAVDNQSDSRNHDNTGAGDQPSDSLTPSRILNSLITDSFIVVRSEYQDKL